MTTTIKQRIRRSTLKVSLMLARIYFGRSESSENAYRHGELLNFEAVSWEYLLLWGAAKQGVEL